MRTRGPVSARSRPRDCALIFRPAHRWFQAYIWEYPPVTKIGTEAEWVDRISLAVSLRDNYDARVQGELVRLIERSL